MTFPDLQSHLRFLFQYKSGDYDIFQQVYDAFAERRCCLDAELLLDTLHTVPCEDRVFALKVSVMYSRHLQALYTWTVYQQENVLETLSEDELHFLVKSHVDSIFAPFSFKNIGPWDTNEDAGPITGPSVEMAAWLAMQYGDWKFLTVLVRYGFWDGSFDPEIEFSDFLKVWKYVHTSCSGRQFGDEQDILIGASYDWQRLHESNGATSGVNRTGGFRRISLIVRTLKSVTTVQPERLLSYQQCLRLHFAVIPDPLVSIEEVRDFLVHLLGSNYDRSAVDRLVEKYRRAFGRDPLGPRSLRHLCRSRLRTGLLVKAAILSATLPPVVEDLYIPETLKDLLLGHPETSSW